MYLHTCILHLHVPLHLLFFTWMYLHTCIINCMYLHTCNPSPACTHTPVSFTCMYLHIGLNRFSLVWTGPDCLFVNSCLYCFVYCGDVTSRYLVPSGSAGRSQTRTGWSHNHSALGTDKATWRRHGDVCGGRARHQSAPSHLSPTRSHRHPRLSPGQTHTHTPIMICFT